MAELDDARHALVAGDTVRWAFGDQVKHPDGHITILDEKGRLKRTITRPTLESLVREGVLVELPRTESDVINFIVSKQ